MNRAIAARRSGPVKAYFCDVQEEAHREVTHGNCFGMVERLSEGKFRLPTQPPTMGYSLTEIGGHYPLCKTEAEYALGTFLCTTRTASVKDCLLAGNGGPPQESFPRIGDLILNPKRQSFFSRVRRCKDDPRESIRQGFSRLA